MQSSQPVANRRIAPLGSLLHVDVEISFAFGGCCVTFNVYNSPSSLPWSLAPAKVHSMCAWIEEAYSPAPQISPAYQCVFLLIFCYSSTKSPYCSIATPSVHFGWYKHFAFIHSMHFHGYRTAIACPGRHFFILFNVGSARHLGASDGEAYILRSSLCVLEVIISLPESWNFCTRLTFILYFLERERDFTSIFNARNLTMFCIFDFILFYYTMS